jgi:uncharacterized protein (DUF433 family)
MITEDFLTEFPELQEEDIYAALAFAADKENKTLRVAG